MAITADVVMAATEAEERTAAAAAAMAGDRTEESGPVEGFARVPPTPLLRAGQISSNAT
jgi:hypothetical protein